MPDGLAEANPVARRQVEKTRIILNLARIIIPGGTIYILGIVFGHNSTVALLKDGKIVRAVSEERFTRRKNEDAIPANSWKWVLESEGITGEELDAVAVVSTENHSDYERARGIALGMPSGARSIWATIDYAHPILRGIVFPLVRLIRKRRSAAGRNAVKKILGKRLGVPESKIHFIDHHTCHAYAGYFGMTDGIEEALVLTLDGEGDGLCATVNVAREGRIRRIAATGGIGGVLNASFNLHGEPMVCSPTDALYTMERSGLKQLVMGNIVVSKR